MSSSRHALLYGSFDAAGVMTVDKPPLALWIQVAFVKAFGLHPTGAASSPATGLYESLGHALAGAG